MRKNLIFALLTLFTFQINAQSYNEKIEKLLELDGTISTIENLITETIEHQKQNNFGISHQYWELLNSKVSKKSLNELNEIVIPIYTQTYSETDIDNLLAFYSSETGKLITENQPVIIEKLSLGLMQWSQNLNSYVIEEIENRGKSEKTSKQLEKFQTEFKDNYGLQILNLTDLAIDQENNIGDLLIDFGRTNGEADITKIIRVKNNSNKEIVFEKSKYFKNDAITFDLGDKPLEISETRDLKITLIAEQAENKNYAMTSINTNDGDKIQFGIKYDAPAKEISFEISDRTLKFKKVIQNFSKPYIFILKNTGKKDFHISDIKSDNSIAYLNYSKEVIEPNKTAKIRVIISKELIEKFDLKNEKLTLKVDLTKGSKGGFSSYANDTIELTIK
ncbi:DUF2059 domain-containing protein [Olleya sp. Bg11-27]|uniref:DUF2059 domain-containing protein n=1 Tax=Olleya sp. Bg11-27 TaxID=2058135 RepID=UPI000C3149F9|nr:DUF2059 domain-containing protein [Olleya sp. Bg11-27]AUC76287.1 hypothetical protein CW732_11670 [Olleya sp. Bg11-27]